MAVPHCSPVPIHSCCTAATQVLQSPCSGAVLPQHSCCAAPLQAAGTAYSQLPHICCLCRPTSAPPPPGRPAPTAPAQAPHSCCSGLLQLALHVLCVGLQQQQAAQAAGGLVARLRAVLLEATAQVQAVRHLREGVRRRGGSSRVSELCVGCTWAESEGCAVRAMTAKVGFLASRMQPTVTRTA